MLHTEMPYEAVLSSAERTRRGQRWRTLCAYLALLAVPCTLVALFLVFVVTSSAGAAGGCGGG
jgi:hypothetical protein